MVSIGDSVREVESRLCARIDRLDMKIEDYIKQQRLEDSEQFKMIIAQNENFRKDFMRLVKICLGVFGGLATVITAILTIKGG